MSNSSILFNDDMTLDLVKNIIKNSYSPVVLLEGRRKVKPGDGPLLTNFARKMAQTFSSVTFRTGNASGSDTYFAKGVAEVDPKRLQYVVPTPGMGLRNRIEGASVLSYDDISKVEDDEINYLSASANENRRDLFEYAKEKPKGKAAAQAKYLLRDTLKVTGSEDAGFSKPVLGFFYVDPAKPLDGGTGHTIKVCQALDVPVITQLAFIDYDL